VVLDWLRGDGWCRAIRVGAPLGAFVVEGWPALLVTVLVQEGGLWLSGRLAEACQRRVAERLFLVALGLRVAVALPSHYIEKIADGNGALFQDDYTNDLVGEWLLRIARGDGISIFPGHQHLLDGVYPYLLMGLYAVFGYAPLLPKLVNIALAALSVVLVFEITRKAFSPRAALLAALGAAVLPTMVVWSIVSLKETIVLVAALLSLWIVQALIPSATAPARRDSLADALVVLVGCLTLLLDLRATTAFIIGALVLIALVARSRFRPDLRQLLLAGVALVVLAGSAVWVARARSERPITLIVEDTALQIRHRRAQEAASARSQLRPEIDVLTATGSELPAAEAASDAAPFTFSDDVLDPLGYALFAPAPWQARGLTELGASAEMLLWYVLLATSLLAVRASPRERGQRLFVGCLALYAIGNWLVLAASEGNLGNLLRHRLMLEPAILILGSAGLEWLWHARHRGGTTLSQSPPLLVSVHGDSP
jgi:hypothetical protein